MAVWAGVDVGARRKGFHVAALDERRLVHGPVNIASVAEAAELLMSFAPLVIGIEPGRPGRDWGRLDGASVLGAGRDRVVRRDRGAGECFPAVTGS